MSMEESLRLCEIFINRWDCAGEKPGERLTCIIITDIINENIDKKEDAAADRMETGGNSWQGQWESGFRILAR